MWKKIGVLIISFIATISICYAFNENLFAGSATYQAGGSINGRIQTAPVGITGSNIGFQKGDKILAGLTGGKSDFSFQLIKNIQDVSILLNGYTLTQRTVSEGGFEWGNTSLPNYVVLEGPAEKAWMTMATTSYVNKAMCTNSTNVDRLVYQNGLRGIFPEDMDFYSDIINLNEELANSTIQPLIRDVNLSHLAAMRNTAANGDSNGLTMKQVGVAVMAFYGKSAFLFDEFSNLGVSNASALPVTNAYAYNIPNKDLAFSEAYWQLASLYGKGYAFTKAGENDYETGGAKRAYSDVIALRPALNLNFDNVVFAVSKGTSTTIGEVTEPFLEAGYTSLYDETLNDGNMKLRIADSSLQVTLNELKDTSGNILKIMNGKSTFYNGESIKISASSSGMSGSTISAIVFDSDGKFKYYQPLGASNGTQMFDFDTSSFPIGDYRIGLVNEDYDDTTTQPAKSSYISNLIDVTVAPVTTQRIQYTETPQNQDTYEYNVNVDEAQKIGILGRRGGVAPIQYQIVGNGDSTYQNFEIVGLDENYKSSATSLDVQVKTSGAPDVVSSTNSLKAGTYKFCVESIDYKGNPSSQVIGESKVCTSLTVNRAKPTLSFQDTGRKDIKLSDNLSTEINLMESSFKDNLTNANITYELENGIANVLGVGANSSNPLQYDFSFAPSINQSNLPVIFRLKAQIKETNNYTASDTVYRDILVYKELSDLNWVADKESYAPSDCVNGEVIGTLLSVDGVGPYVYALTTAADVGYDPSFANSSFSISSTPLDKWVRADVETRTSLTAGTYNIQFKVTDAKNKSVTKVAQITVHADEQTGFVWKDAVGGNEITTGSIAVAFGTQNKKLVAEGGQSSGAVVYELAPIEKQPDDLVGNASDYVSINSSSGILTEIKKVGSVTVMATRPGNATYSDKKIYLTLNITQATQSINFKSGVVDKVQVGDKAIIDATGIPGYGGIYYSSDKPEIATVNATTGEVTGVSAGSFELTATLNKKEGNDAYNPNYETKSTSKIITIYKPMEFSWENANPKVKANANAIGDTMGTIIVKNKSGSAPLTATLSTSTETVNKDKDYFIEPIVNGTNVILKLKKSIDAAAYVSHQGGIFKVQVIITDGNGPQSYDVIALVDPATNSVNFTNQDGAIITSLDKVYADNNNKFKLTSQSSSNSSIEAITYSAKDPTQDILKVNGIGDVEILKAGSTTVSVHIGESNGYGEADKDMVVTVKPASQEIKFDDSTDPFKIELGGTSKLQAATANVVLSDGTKSSGVGDIIYSSSNPAIANIDSSTGEVTPITLGPQVVIKATINDPTSTNYNANYETKSCEKKVQVFTGKDAEWYQDTPNAKAGSVLGNKKVGEIRTQNTSGPIFYEVISGADKDMFAVINNGTSADVKFKPEVVITAGDLFQHGSEYKCTINVKDDNGITPVDVLVTIDDAEDSIIFKKDNITITNISEKYGVNSGNEFSIIAIANSGKAVKYEVTGDKTIIDVNPTTGKASIKKTGSTTIEASVLAGNGYAASKKTIAVEIEIGDQWIKFAKDDTSHTFVENTPFEAKAILSEITQENKSDRLITYESLTPTFCEMDQSGNVTMLELGDCRIKAKNADANWSEASVEKTINLYDRINASLSNPTPNLQAETVNTNMGSKVGDIQVNGGSGNKSFAKSTDTTDVKNKDAKFFKVNPTTGVVSFDQSIKATDLEGKYNSTKMLYELYVQVVVTDELSNVTNAECIIEIKGAPLKAEFETNGTGEIKEVYAADKTFSLELASNKGNGIPSYKIKENSNSPEDVVTVDVDGLVHVLHANDKENDPNPVIVQAIIPANHGYDAETIEVPLEISKALQPDFAFKTKNIKLGYSAQFTPIFLNQLSTGSISLSSATPKIASISGTDIIAGTMDGSVEVTAVDSGDRDYQEGIAKANVSVSGAGAYNLVVSVPPATYGDTNLKATAKAIGSVGTNPQVTWSSKNEGIAEIDADGNLTIHQAGTVEITCTRTTLEEPSVTTTVNFIIDPKPITITINDASKYVGENVPTFTANIPTSDLVGSDTLGQPTFSCKDGTSLVKPDTKAGKYDINGTYSTASNSNYKITVKKGVLTIKQDTSLASWFHLEGATSKTKLDGTKWVNEDVKVVLDKASESAGTYDELSLDKALWGTSQTFNKEGVFTSDVYFRINASKVIATPHTTSVKIDKTKPVIKSITGTPAKRNAIKELLNNVTFGKYFKPQLEVSIQAEDILPKDVKENSGLKNIHYNVYQINADSTLSDVIASGNMKTSDTLKLVDEGKYFVCATAEDNAGNVSSESCSGINIQEIGDDSDDDGIPDLNIDVDGDGIPELNITKNKEDKVPYTNIDTDGNGIEDMNIDIDKDGIPDLNTGLVSEWTCDLEVDLDKDGKVDYKTSSTLKGLNNIDSDGDLHPDINIDLTLNGLPTLNINTDGSLDKPQTNIDGDGDGISDINVDENGDGIPDKKIVVITNWSPELNVKKDEKVLYDTMAISYIEKGELEDNGIVIKPSDPGHTFLPNYALKVNDITKDLNEETKNAIIEITGKNSEVKHVYDVSLSDGDKIIQPDGSIIVRIPVDKTIKNPRILLRNEAGIFEEMNATIEDGYYVFETNYLGQVSIVGDKEEVEVPSDPSDPEIPEDPTPSPPKSTAPETSVKGNYTNNSIGGALTGDSTQKMNWLFAMVGSVIFVIFGCYKYNKESNK